MMRNCGVTVEDMGRNSKPVSIERRGCMLYFVRFISLSYFSCCHILTFAIFLTGYGLIHDFCVIYFLFLCIRFMIQCDVRGPACLVWYHGPCVKISTKRGQQIERKFIPFVFYNCST